MISNQKWINFGEDCQENGRIQLGVHMKNFHNQIKGSILQDYANSLELRSKYLKQVYDSFKINRKFDSYLDIGCGWGYNSLTFGTGIKKVICIDTSHENLITAKNNLKGTNIKLQFGDITKTTFKDKEFGLITSFSVLEHIKELDKVIKEIKRVLKDDGILVLQQPNNHFIIEHHTYLPFTFLIPDFIRFPLFKKLGFSNEDMNASTLSIKKLLKKLESEGFDVKIKKMIYPKNLMPEIASPFYDILLKLKIFNIIPFGYFLICEKK